MSNDSCRQLTSSQEAVTGFFPWCFQHWIAKTKKRKITMEARNEGENRAELPECIEENMNERPSSASPLKRGRLLHTLVFAYGTSSVLSLEKLVVAHTRHRHALFCNADLAPQGRIQDSWRTTITVCRPPKPSSSTSSSVGKVTTNALCISMLLSGYSPMEYSRLFNESGTKGSNQHADTPAAQRLLP